MEISIDHVVWIPCFHVNMTLEQAMEFHKDVLTRRVH